ASAGTRAAGAAGEGAGGAAPGAAQEARRAAAKTAAKRRRARLRGEGGGLVLAVTARFGQARMRAYPQSAPAAMLGSAPSVEPFAAWPIRRMLARCDAG